MWESEEAVSESSDGNSDYEDNSVSRKTLESSRRPGGEHGAEERVDRSHGVKTKKLPVTETMPEEELGISSRGRIRKRRIIPNNSEDQGLSKKAKPAEAITTKTGQNHQSATPAPNILQKSRSSSSHGSSEENAAIKAVLSQPPSARVPSGGLAFVGNQPVLIQGNQLQALGIGGNSLVLAQVVGSRAAAAATSQPLTTLNIGQGLQLLSPSPGLIDQPQQTGIVAMSHPKLGSQEIATSISEPSSNKYGTHKYPAAEKAQAEDPSPDLAVSSSRVTSSLTDQPKELEAEPVPSLTDVTNAVVTKPDLETWKPPPQIALSQLETLETEQQTPKLESGCMENVCEASVPQPATQTSALFPSSLTTGVQSTAPVVAAGKGTKPAKPDVKPNSSNRIASSQLRVVVSTNTCFILPKTEPLQATAGIESLQSPTKGLKLASSPPFFNYTNISQLPPYIVQQLLKTQEQRLKMTTQASVSTKAVQGVNTVAALASGPSSLSTTSQQTALTNLIQAGFLSGSKKPAVIEQPSMTLSSPISEQVTAAGTEDKVTAKGSSKAIIPTVSSGLGVIITPNPGMQVAQASCNTSAKLVTRLPDKQPIAAAVAVAKSSESPVPVALKSGQPSQLLALRSPIPLGSLPLLASPQKSKQTKYANNVTVRALLESKAAHGKAPIPGSATVLKPSTVSLVTGAAVAAIVSPIKSSSVANLIPQQIPLTGTKMLSPTKPTTRIVPQGMTGQNMQKPVKTEVVPVSKSAFKGSTGFTLGQIQVLPSTIASQIIQQQASNTLQVPVTQQVKLVVTGVVTSTPGNNSSVASTISSSANQSVPTVTTAATKVVAAIGQNIIPLTPQVAQQLQVAIAKKKVVDNAVKAAITTAVHTSLPTAQIKVSSPFQMPSQRRHRPVTSTTTAMKAPIPALPKVRGHARPQMSTLCLVEGSTSGLSPASSSTGSGHHCTSVLPGLQGAPNELYIQAGTPNMGKDTKPEVLDPVRNAQDYQCESETYDSTASPEHHLNSPPVNVTTGGEEGQLPKISPTQPYTNTVGVSENKLAQDALPTSPHVAPATAAVQQHDAGNSKPEKLSQPEENSPKENSPEKTSDVTPVTSSGSLFTHHETAVQGLIALHQQFIVSTASTSTSPKASVQDSFMSSATSEETSPLLHVVSAPSETQLAASSSKALLSPSYTPSKNTVLKLTPQNILTSQGIAQGIVLPQGISLPPQAMEQLRKHPNGSSMIIFQQAGSGGSGMLRVVQSGSSQWPEGKTVVVQQSVPNSATITSPRNTTTSQSKVAMSKQSQAAEEMKNIKDAPAVKNLSPALGIGSASQLKQMLVPPVEVRTDGISLTATSLPLSNKPEKVVPANHRNLVMATVAGKVPSPLRLSPQSPIKLINAVSKNLTASGAADPAAASTAPLQKILPSPQKAITAGGVLLVSSSPQAHGYIPVIGGLSVAANKGTGMPTTPQAGVVLPSKPQTVKFQSPVKELAGGQQVQLVSRVAQTSETALRVSKNIAAGDQSKPAQPTRMQPMTVISSAVRMPGVAQQPLTLQVSSMRTARGNLPLQPVQLTRSARPTPAVVIQPQVIGTASSQAIPPALAKQAVLLPVQGTHPQTSRAVLMEAAPVQVPKLAPQTLVLQSPNVLQIPGSTPPAETSKVVLYNINGQLVTAQGIPVSLNQGVLNLQTATTSNNQQKLS